MPVTVAIPKESLPGERRVALVPDVVEKLTSLGDFAFRLQRGAGLAAGYPDDEYEAVTVCDDLASTVSGCDIVLMINPPSPEIVELLPQHSLLATTLFPHMNKDMVRQLLNRRITSLALERIPRISRAHAMNITSSQGMIAGYKAALLAAELSPRLWPMVTTPAGTVKPSTVVVIGAGTAGLQAIATARRLGARVEAYDIRPAARDQVESLGASMIEPGIDVHGTSGHGRALTDEEKETQHELLADVLSRAHAVICTAALPGRSAPRIITTDMVERMPRGAIVIDIAARSGGNCELTEAGKTVWHGDKRIVGAVDLASAASVHSSELYARNMLHLLKFVVGDTGLALNFSDPIIIDMATTYKGHAVDEATAEMLGVNAISCEAIADGELDKPSATSDAAAGNKAKQARSGSSTKKSKDATADTTADWVDTDDQSPESGDRGAEKG